MSFRRHGTWGFLLTGILCGAVACAGGDDGPPADGAGGNGGSDIGDGGSGGDGGKDLPIPEGECGKQANLDKRDALLAAQPEIGVRSRSVLDLTVKFASVADDPNQECEVDLQFRDINGNGSLDVYEDWTRSVDERAANLLERMELEEKAALLAHPALADTPDHIDQEVLAETKELLTSGVRFGRTAANGATPTQRATWANNLQELAEATDLGIPFVISSEPAHSEGNGRTVARGFAAWPHELAIGATQNPATAEEFGRVVATEFRAIGLGMLLSPAGNLATDPRWHGSQFTFGEDSAKVAEMVGAFVKGTQGETLGSQSVATVIGNFPGAGATKTGYDGRLEKGRYLTYSGDSMDAHIAPFASAVEAGVAGVMTGHGVVEQGSWTAADGAIDGSSLAQVGVSFNAALVDDALRGKVGHEGLVLSGWNALEDAGSPALGAPWGVEVEATYERLAAAVDAGVDQFGGLADPSLVLDAVDGDLITEEQVEQAAARALKLTFALGLFENPYVDDKQAPAKTNADAAKRGGWAAMGNGMVLLVNEEKPDGWLNGSGDGTQRADKGNAGNGSGLVIPAPPGEPYVAAGCAYFVDGDFDLDYVRSVSAGYGELTNDSVELKGEPVNTEAERIARSDYVFLRIKAPCEKDADSGALEHCDTSLEYANEEEALAELAAVRAAIDALPGSKTQIVVGIDGGRPSVIQQIRDYGVSAIFQTWSVSDKVFLDVAFGIVNSGGKLPVGLPLSDEAAAEQRPDLPGDGQDPDFKAGHGYGITAF